MSLTVTIEDCYEGVCPCSRPTPPDPGHVCPSNGMTIEEDEAMRYRPFEEDEGIPLSSSPPCQEFSVARRRAA